MNILFMLSGSIACFKACSVISTLVREGFEVKTACTRAALEFIGIATLEGLTRRPCYTDMFERRRTLEHVDLGNWYDLAIICPVTADIINKMAAGIGDCPVSTLFLAHDFSKPFLVVPAMNERMLLHPTTVGSVKKLNSWGISVLNPGTGRLACGVSGKGRLMEPDDIYNSIIQALGKENSKSFKVERVDSEIFQEGENENSGYIRGN